MDKNHNASQSVCSEEKKDWKNPFAPYDEALWVDSLSTTHMLLLNKFNVVAHHVLIVTRRFEKQTDPLNLQDLEATWQVVQVIHVALMHWANVICQGFQHALQSCRLSLQALLHTLTLDQSLAQVSRISMSR